MELSLNKNMDFLLYEKGESFLLNGISQRGLFEEVTNRLSFYDDVILTTNIPFEIGDSIIYHGFTWLVISQVQENQDSDISIYRARIRRSNYLIKFNFQGNIRPFSTILETKVLDIQSGQYVTLPVGKIVITLQDNVDSRDIVLGQRFLIMGQPWKVSGIDKSQTGLIKLNCDYDSFNSNDDRVNEIADRWAYEVTHTYVLTIDNGDISTVNINDVITINAGVTDNGVAMVSPDITYLSSDSNIACVDNSGKVMGIGLGTANITAQMTNNPDVKDVITITVQEAPTSHNYSITITGSASIKVGQTQSYIATFYDNGIEVADQSGAWTVLDTDGTSTTYASITTQTGNSVSVKAGSTSNVYVDLICTLNSDNSIMANKNIKIASLW